MSLGHPAEQTGVYSTLLAGVPGISCCLLGKLIEKSIVARTPGVPATPGRPGVLLRAALLPNYRPEHFWTLDLTIASIFSEKPGIRLGLFSYGVFPRVPFHRLLESSFF